MFPIPAMPSATPFIASMNCLKIIIPPTSKPPANNLSHSISPDSSVTKSQINLKAFKICSPIYLITLNTGARPSLIPLMKPCIVLTPISWVLTDGEWHPKADAKAAINSVQKLIILPMILPEIPSSIPF